MSAESTLNERSGTAASLRSLVAGGLEGRTKYLIAAICMAICAIMLAPLVPITVVASLKTTMEQAAVPPTWFPHELSLDSYVKLWNYQDGLPIYLFNSATAFLTNAFALG